MRSQFHSLINLGALFSAAAACTMLMQPTAFAASCCGGAVAVPAVISGDEKAKVSISHAYNQVNIDNVNSDGIWRRSEREPVTRTTKIDVGHIFYDRWQTGMIVPLVQREAAGENYDGIGDLQLHLGYEAIPDWDYHPIRPKVITFIQLLVPTGRSKFESNQGGYDSFGHGFWGLSLGAMASKAFAKIDAYAMAMMRRSFAKESDSDPSLGELDLKPGWGASAALGVGYNWSKLRWGFDLTHQYEDPIHRVSKQGELDRSGAERVSTLATSLAYLIDDAWTASLSYSDQSLIGSPVNTSLGRAVAVQLMRRWPR